MVKKAKSWCSKHWFATAFVGVLFLASMAGLAVNLIQLKQLTFGDTPPAHLMGWAGEDQAKAAWAELKGKFPKFKISGAKESSEGKVIKLWDAAKVVNGGEHLPTLRQEIGDCVAFGHTQGLQYLQCAAMAAGTLNEYKPIFPPYHYACGRVIIGKNQIRGPDGSVGSWQVDALKQYGCLPDDAEGTPEYSGSVARQWANKRPSDAHIKAGKEHLLGTAAQVTTYAEARDAIANGYPVTVCSNRGFAMAAKTSGGKSWGVPGGRWDHCMVWIGVDDTVQCPSFAGGGKGALYLLNSWGPDAHGQPADDAPPGGFWVSSKVAESMLKQEDSFALSDLTGFPARDPEWNFGKVNRRRAVDRILRTAMFAVAL